MINELSGNLGLTEQQRQRAFPIIKQEFMQLAALKKDTSLSAARKVERLREIGVSFDGKLKPIINAEQQEKFQAFREQFRRRLIEKLLNKAAEAVKADIKDVEADVWAWFTSKSEK